jgi:5-bromo-4-chloroindolyl phosphate hydrolysis protein
MRTTTEFNEKYKDYLEEGHYGIDINEPSVITYVDQIFNDLTQIPGFKYQQIKTKFGLTRVYTNLDELMPFAGRILNQELEEKINFILKVEYEIENRLQSLNLDKYGKPIQEV